VPLTWVGLVTSSALQSRKWQLIGMSQWCCSALCGHPLPTLTDTWTHGAASRHTIAQISHARPLPHSRSYYLFPVPLRVGGCVGLYSLPYLHLATCQLWCWSEEGEYLPNCLCAKSKGKGKWIYIALVFVAHAIALSHGSHSFTCNYTNACLYLVSIHQMVPPQTEVADI